jgi:hypothetical protein
MKKSFYYLLLFAIAGSFSLSSFASLDGKGAGISITCDSGYDLIGKNDIFPGANPISFIAGLANAAQELKSRSLTCVKAVAGGCSGYKKGASYGSNAGKKQKIRSNRRFYFKKKGAICEAITAKIVGCPKGYALDNHKNGLDTCSKLGKLPVPPTCPKGYVIPPPSLAFKYSQAYGSNKDGLDHCIRVYTRSQSGGGFDYKRPKVTNGNAK